MAYASVGTIYLGRGNFTKAIANETKAYELRDRLTGQLKFLAETLYYGVGTGDLERALPVYQEWVHDFPLDGVAHNNFAAELFYLGRYDEAAAEVREAVRLMPMLGVGRNGLLMQTATYVNRLDEAKVIFGQAKAQGVDSPFMHDMRHLIAFLQHDEAAMQEELMWISGGTGRGSGQQREADVQAYYGHFANARRLLQQASKDSPRIAAEPIIFSRFVNDLAKQEAEIGNTARAEKLVKDARPIVQDRFGQLGLALTFARTGRSEAATRLVEEINRESPRDTLVQRYHLPTIRAAIKLQENDPAGAVEILRPADKYELAFPSAFNSVYPAYIRGLAYLQLGQGRAAAAEFQKLLDHPAIVGRYVTGALAHLQVGRAQVMMGDKTAARKSYQDFLTLWKDADPDIPIYKQAKSEFAALQ